MKEQQRPNTIIHYLPSQQCTVKDASAATAAATSIGPDTAANTSNNHKKNGMMDSNNARSRFIHTARQKASRRRHGRAAGHDNNTSVGSFLLVPTTKEVTSNRTVLVSSSSSNGKNNVNNSSDNSGYCRKSRNGGGGGGSRFNEKDSSFLHPAGATTTTTSNTANSTTVRSTCSSDDCSSTNYTEDSGDTYFHITYHPGGYQGASTSTTTPRENKKGPGAKTAIAVSPSPARSTRSNRRSNNHNNKKKKNLSNDSMGDAKPRLLQGHQYDFQGEPFEDMDIIHILPDVEVNNNGGGDDGDDDTLDGSIEVSYKNSSQNTDGTAEDVVPPFKDSIDTLDDSIEISIRDASSMRDTYGIFRREEETITSLDYIVADIPKPRRVSKSKVVMVPKIPFPTSTNKTTPGKPYSVPFETKKQGVDPDYTGIKQHTLNLSHPSLDAEAEIDSSNDGHSMWGRGNVEVETVQQRQKSPQNEKFVLADNLSPETKNHFPRTLRPAASVKRALKSMTKLMDIRQYQQGQKSKILGQEMQILVEVDDDDCNTVEVFTDGPSAIPKRQASKKNRMEKRDFIGNGKRYFPVNHGRIDAAHVSLSAQTRPPISKFLFEENDSTTNSIFKVSDGSSGFCVNRLTSGVETFNEIEESKEKSFQNFGRNKCLDDEKKMGGISTRLGGESKIVKFVEDDQISEATTFKTTVPRKDIAVSPSPRDTQYFIRPNHFLVTPDVSEKSIEITRQRSVATHNDKSQGRNEVVKEVSSKAKRNDHSSSRMKSSTSEMETYLLTVKIHGVTGIVSGCNNRADVRVTDSASCPRVMVGISEQGANHVKDHTSFSEDPVFSSFERKCPGRGDHEMPRISRRSHVAMWSASRASQITDSEMKMLLPNVQRVDGNDPLSRYLPIILDLTIAVGPFGSTSGCESFAIPVGAAKLKVSNEDIRGGENRHLDIPVLSLVQSKELSRLASESRSSSSDAFGVAVIELSVDETRASSRSGRQKPQRDSDSTSKCLSSVMISSYHSKYGIDWGDDAFIRIEYFVEKVNGDTKKLSMEKTQRQMRGTAPHAKEHRSPLIEFNKAPPSDSIRDMMEDATSFCTVDSKVVESIKLAYQTDRRGTRVRRRSAYSSPLGFHQTTETDAVVNDNVPASRQHESFYDVDSRFFSCGILQSNQQFPVQDQVVGHSITTPAETFLEPSTCCASYANGNEKENSSFLDTSLLLGRSKTGEESFSHNSFSEVSKDASLLASMDDEESFSRNSYSVVSQKPGEGISVCRSRMGRGKGQENRAQEDVKQILTKTTGAVKDFVADKFGKWAVTRAEELFPSDATNTEQTLPDEDITSVGDATLEAFMNGRLRMWSVDDRKSNYYNDDETLEMTATYDSRSTKCSFRNLQSKLTDGRSRSSIPPISSKNVPQHRPYAHEEFQSSIENDDSASAENDTFTLGSSNMLSKSCSSMDKTFRTMDTKTETLVKDEEDDTTLNLESQEGSLTGQSVVEAIAEVISNYTSCGSIRMISNSRSKQKKTHEITEQVPDTIFDPGEDASELNSLGELTVGTFGTQEALEKKYKPAIPAVEDSTTKVRQYQQLHPNLHQISRQTIAVGDPGSISSQHSSIHS